MNNLFKNDEVHRAVCENGDNGIKQGSNALASSSPCAAHNETNVIKMDCTNDKKTDATPKPFFFSYRS